MPTYVVTIVGLDSEATQGYNPNATHTVQVEADNAEEIETEDRFTEVILEFASEDLGSPVYAFDGFLSVVPV